MITIELPRAAKPGPPKTILDLPAYMRQKNRERREKARCTGVCMSCNDEPSEEGFTKCRDCRRIHNANQRKAA